MAVELRCGSTMKPKNMCFELQNFKGMDNKINNKLDSYMNPSLMDQVHSSVKESQMNMVRAYLGIRLEVRLLTVLIERIKMDISWR